MTREEAITQLKMDRDLCNFNPMTGEEEPMSEDCRKSAEALDIAIKTLEQEPCEDCISKADALCVAKNEYLRGWHEALCKALNEKYLIHCEEGNFEVIQKETIVGLGLSMDCALGKDAESYMSTIPSVIPTKCIATVKFSKEDMQELVNEKMKDIVVERKKGKWLNKDTSGYYFYGKCSECGQEFCVNVWYTQNMKHCPNCGARMDEDERTLKYADQDTMMPAT